MWNLCKIGARNSPKPNASVEKLNGREPDGNSCFADFEKMQKPQTKSLEKMFNLEHCTARNTIWFRNKIVDIFFCLLYVLFMLTSLMLTENSSAFFYLIEERSFHIEKSITFSEHAAYIVWIRSI